MPLTQGLRWRHRGRRQPRRQWTRLHHHWRDPAADRRSVCSTAPDGTMRQLLRVQRRRWAGLRIGRSGGRGHSRPDLQARRTAPQVKFSTATAAELASFFAFDRTGGGVRVAGITESAREPPTSWQPPAGGGPEYGIDLTTKQVVTFRLRCVIQRRRLWARSRVNQRRHRDVGAPSNEGTVADRRRRERHASINLQTS